MSQMDPVGKINLSVNFEWAIKDARNLFKSKEVDEYILSPPFRDKELVWHILLYPSGRTVNKKIVRIYLCLYTENFLCCENYSVNFEFFVLSEKKETFTKTGLLHGNFDLAKTEKFSEFSNGFYSAKGVKLLPISELDKYFAANESFIINCKIDKNDFLDFGCNVDHNSTKIVENVSYLNCSNFLNDEKYSDLELIVGKKKYFAHKVILTSKSPIFLNFLESNEAHKKQIIEINDLREDTVQEMLRFVYTNKVENIDNLAQDLLTASDKYGLVELKDICEEEMIKKISVENSIDLLIFASAHNASNLKIKTIDVVVKNIKQLKMTENWSKLDKNLMTDIISELTKIKP